MNAPAVRGQAEQVERIKAVREAADAAGVPMVINARTDLLLKDPDIANHALLFDEIVERAAAYAEAGADCLFVPALHNDLALVARICAAVPLPVRPSCCRHWDRRCRALPHVSASKNATTARARSPVSRRNAAEARGCAVDDKTAFVRST